MGLSPISLSKHCLVFHDLSVNPLPTLENLFRVSQSNLQLQRVLQACEQGIRAEFAILSAHDRHRIRPFRTLPEILRSVKQLTHINVTLSAILTVTAQLGCFSLFVDENPAVISVSCHDYKFLGLCKGIIVAATAAAVTSPSDILRLAEPILRVAFRFGLEADRRGQALDPKDGSWAIALPELTLPDVESLIREFISFSNSPPHLAPYVSAVLPTCSTVSGTPTTLLSMIDTILSPRKIPYKPLNITAPFHASHLPSPNVSYIVDVPGLGDFNLRKTISVIPSQTSVRLEDGNLRSVLHKLISGVFQSRMVLQSLSECSDDGIGAHLENVISVQPCFPTDAAKRLLGIGKEVEYSIASLGTYAQKVRGRNRDEDVAIIGMAGRFPRADTLDEYWDIIATGRDVHEPISRRMRPRVNETGSDGPASKSSGCFMKNPGLFDHAFFNLSPREAKQIDPQHRILLMVTQEALQMIGYSHAGSKRIGTFFGQATDDWRESHIRQDIDIFYIGGGMRAFAPGRLNYHYKWEGPSYNVDAACSASLAALEMATKSIQSGDCDLAVVGGGNLCSALPMFEGLAKGRFTSKSGSCKTFCATADGYCRGEAVGVVILQRLGDAVREGTNVHGIVAGIATNHSAWASSITHPHSGAQEELMHTALDLAALSPGDIDYVEFHGTGTQAGDKAEMESVSRVFDQQGTRSTPLYVGAVKSNIGHCEAAAGIVSLIKALLMFRHDVVPPHCGIKSHINPAVAQVMSSDLHIPEQAVPFSRVDRPRNIIVNNFNATGGNTCAVIREPPQARALVGTDPRSYFPVVITGQSQTALRANLVKVRDHVSACIKSSKSLAPHLSYSTTARRSHYNHRKAFTIQSEDDLVEKIEQSLVECDTTVNTKSVLGAAFVFAGQGTQKQGIAAELFETSTFFKTTLQKFDTLCQSLGFSPFIRFLVEKDIEASWSTVQLQLATVAIEVALARLWQRWGIFPSFVIGHSIGEYAALCVAGVISETDMFSLVGTRAQLMEELCQADTHSMLSVQAPPSVLEGYLSSPQLDGCEISCYNSPQAVTLGGPGDKLEALKDQLTSAKIKSILLNARYAFHSPNIEPILARYRTFAETIPFKPAQIPVRSTLLGVTVSGEGTFGAQYLVNQTRNPVQFTDALKTVTEPAFWIEFGPGDPACLSFVKSAVDPQLQVQVLPSLSTRIPTWQSISDNVAKCFEQGINVDWSSYHRDYEASLRLLELPTYSFDLQEFWMPVDTDIAEPNIETPIVQLDPFLHTVQRSFSTNNGSLMEFRSSLDDELLCNTISGHFVMDAPLCPSSVYSVMALRAASMLQKDHIDKVTESHDLLWTLERMNIHQPLVLRPADNRAFGVTASQGKDTGSIAVKFSSYEDGKDTQDHARCVLATASKAAWQSQWSKVEFLVASRMDYLTTSNSPSLHRLTRPVIYKLFSHIVNYGRPFHGIQSIILDTAANEAVADIQFDESSNPSEDYDVHLMDSLMHFAGFILNNGIEDEDFAYVSDGWECLQVPQGLRPTDTYKFYVRLAADSKDKSYSGDLYCFIDGKIVASCNGVRFSKMKKESLRRALSRGTGQKSVTQQPKSDDAGTTDQERRRPEDIGSTNNEHNSTSGENLEQRLRGIIAEEAGVPADTIIGSSSLSELGLDSILMSTVLDKIQDQIGVEIPSSQALGAQSFDELKALALPQQSSKTPASSGIATPVRSESESSRSVASTAPTNLSSNEASVSTTQQSNVFATVISIISQHTGVSEDTVRTTDDFSKLGVDSMLSFDILDMVQETSGVELPSSFLQHNPTVTAVSRALAAQGLCASGSKDTSPSTTKARNTPMTSAINTPVSAPSPSVSCAISPQIRPMTKAHVPSRDNATHEVQMTEAVAALPSTAREQHLNPNDDFNPCDLQCRLRLVQGNPSSPHPPIFLFPPGEGTSFEYSHLPTNPVNAPMYCAESPFLDNPDDPNHTFANVCLAFKTTIQRKSPHGPYFLGGYSVGGAYAFEVARLLLFEGKELRWLAIIDTPAPTEPLESGKWFGVEASQMVGFTSFARNKNIARRAAAAAREFNRYVPTAFGEKRPGKVVVIWASHGKQEELLKRCLVEQDLLDRCPGRERAALIEERKKVNSGKEWCQVAHTDFGLRGWEKWLGQKDVVVEAVEADHHSIMRDSKRVAKVGAIIYAALSR